MVGHVHSSGHLLTAVWRTSWRCLRSLLALIWEKVYNGTGSGAVRTPGDSWGAADGNFGYKRFSETQLRAT